MCKEIKCSVARVLFILLIVTSAGCEILADRYDGPRGEPRDAAWVDLGLIPGVKAIGGVVTVGSDVLVGTDLGVWRRNLDDDDADWVQSGLEGLEVRTLRTIPGKDDVVMAGVNPGQSESILPFHHSSDGGQNWTGYGDGLFDDFRGAHVAIEDIAVKPGTGGGWLFANIEGLSIVFSDTRGQSWKVVKGALDSFGYPCLLHVPEGNPSVLYQGCESPLDFAWIRTHDISGEEVSDLGDGDLLVGTDDIENRRINSFFSFGSHPGTVYAGLEGGLLKIEDGDWDWVWRTDGDEEHGYTYVKFVWVDPIDHRYIVFGGGDGDGSESTRAGMWQSFDGGKEVLPLDGPEGVNLRVGGVRAGAPVNDGHDFVVAALTEAGARVLLLEHE